MTEMTAPHQTDDTPTDVRQRLATLIRELAPDTQAPTPHRARPPSTSPRPNTRPTNTRQPPSTSPPGADWSTSPAGRLVERWLPGGTKAVNGVRGAAGRRPITAIMIIVGIAAAIITAVTVLNQQPPAESAPTLPPAAIATNVADASTTDRPPSKLVISVVGRVQSPGLVTVPNGARVADALKAAGGTQPSTDTGALNLARKLADGEQIYVGVPIPVGASEEQPTPPTGAATNLPPAAGKKGHKQATSAEKVNLNTATPDDLLSLPGVGPATAQRIVAWRTSHGQFESVSQLRDVGGIGPAKFAKLEPLVTT